MSALDAQIGQWRAAVLRGHAVTPDDADELEAHLREQITELRDAGLSDEEAFLIAVRRLGEVDALTAEFAREHSDRLWKQLAVARRDAGSSTGFLPVLGFAVASGGLLTLAWNLLGAGQVIVNGSLIVLVVLAAYFAQRRGLDHRRLLALAAMTAAIAIAVNVFPFTFPASQTWVLAAIHLPVLLWFAVGVAYASGDVRSEARRMDFIRFSGEWFIYLVLIALGGGVLMGLTAAVLSPIVPEAVPHVLTWVIPAGIGGAVVVAAWLVEAKQSIIENLAPVLTAIFTPLFALMLLAAATVYAVGGLGRAFDRDLLIVFDALLIVVLALVVYGISARDSVQRPGPMDVLRLIAVAAAVLLDLLVLVSLLQRVGEYGFTPNRVAALGLNIILLVNLVVTAVHAVRMLTGRSVPSRIERWQTDYLPVFGLWAGLVVLVLPPVFGFR